MLRLETGAGATVVVVGAGGVIGSHLVPHLARDRRIGTLVLIDRDRYETGNLTSQAISVAHVGRTKAAVQAERARAIRPDLEVVALAEDVESLPAGWLRADVILACLDSRRARQHVNQLAWRLGVPWIDGGVLGGGLLARVDRFDPGVESACLECRWSEADYAALEQRYPCDPDGVETAATGSGSGLGALTAALQAIECGKLLAGEEWALGAGEQIVLDARHQRHLRTRFLRNPDCRLNGHAIWDVRRLPASVAELTLRGLFDRVRPELLDRAAAARDGVDRDGALGLRVEPLRFGTAWLCPGCGETSRAVRLAVRADARERACPGCGEETVPTGFDSVERLTAGRLEADDSERPLSELGLRERDVVSVGIPGAELHLELAAARAGAPEPAGRSPRAERTTTKKEET